MDLSIVVPLYNEEEALEDLYNEIVDALDEAGLEYELLLVDDGSRDSTPQKLAALAHDDSRVRVIRFSRNFGQTAAMMAGIDHARSEIIVCMDGDRQNDPADILLLLRTLGEGWDVVSGWRRNRQDRALSRKLPSMLANRLISFMSGIELHDYGCTLKAYRARVLKNVRLYGEMHRFVPIYASWEGARVTEVPVNHRPRTTGKAKYGLERIYKVLLDLLLLKFLAKYAHRPLHFFGGMGFANLALALLCVLVAFYFKFLGNKTFIETPLPILTVFFALTGILCGLMGILAEILMRTYHESQDRPPYMILETHNIEDPQG
jgi:glycosyltransferase involved in cell wall biosynthesis